MNLRNEEKKNEPEQIQMKHKLATCWIHIDEQPKMIRQINMCWKFNYICKCISIQPYQFLSNKNWGIKNKMPSNFRKIYWKFHVIRIFLNCYVHWTIYVFMLLVSNESQKREFSRNTVDRMPHPLSLSVSVLACVQR